MYEKVFGIGLNKTGTKTLGACLRHFGFNHMSCRRDLLEAFRTNRWDEVFAVTDQYDSFEDWPYPLMYRELLQRYGSKAAFILTTRDTPEIWLESLKTHSLQSNPDRHCRLMAYGYNYPHGYEHEHIEFYDVHNRSVVRHFAERGASSQLLTICWEQGHGWKELCHFLQVAEPETAFPHANRKRDIPDNDRLAENLKRILVQLEETRGADPRHARPRVASA
jgi:hypothetical protein